MTENNDTTHVPPSLTFESLGYLGNHSSTDNPDQSQQLETYANELTTNIIKDANQTASRNHDENFDNTGIDNTNELNFSLPQTSKQNQSENTTTTTTALDKSEYSTSNGIHDENNFDEDIQKKMTGVIHDIQSGSGTSRKSVTSNHIHDDQINNSTSKIIDPLSTNPTEGPIQSMNESTEQSSPLPIQRDDSSTDADDMFGIKSKPTHTNIPIDDSIDQHSSQQENHRNKPLDDNDDFFNTKVATVDDDQQPSTSVTKQNDLDETTRFGTTSSSRVQSSSSKRSVRVTPDEPSISSDEKHTQMSPSKLPDDTGNDTDRDNQEVTIIARRPSRAMSPLNRPRSPTPNDSRKVSISNEPPTAIISPGSRRESTNKNDQQQTSRSITAIQTKSDDNSFEPSTSRQSSARTNQFITTDEQSNLIKSGEQLQIPTDDLNNERLNSPSPRLPKNIKSLVSINPLLGNNLVQNEQDQIGPSSETNRKSLTTSVISNEKVIDGDVLSSKSRRESNISQHQTNNTDQKSPSRRGSQVIEQTPQISSSRRASSSQQPNELDSYREQQIASRRTSNVLQEPTSHQASFVLEQKTSSRRESVTDEQKMASRKESTVSEQQPPSRKESTVSEQKLPSRKESTASEQQTSSRRGTTADEPQVSSKRESIAPEQRSSSRQGSTADEQKPPSRKESTADEQKPPSRKESTADEQKPPSRKESTADEQKPPSRKESTASGQQVPSKRSSIAPERQTFNRRESAADEQKTTSRKGTNASEQQGSSKRESSVPEQQNSHHRQSSFDQHEQKSTSKPVSRKTSVVEQQQIASRRTSINRDNQPSSLRRSSNIHSSSSQESIRRNHVTKQEQQPIPVVVNKDSHRSSLNIIDTNHKEVPSSDIDALPIQTSTNHKQERKSSIDKRQKSSSTADENDHRRSSFQQRSGQESKRNSNLITDETVVTPIIMDSSKVRQQNGKRTSITDLSYDQTPTSKLPPVTSSLQQEKPRHSETLTSEDDQATHWTRQIMVPSIHLSDDEISSSREDQPRPQSPNVEQIAERNPPPSPPIITTSTIKKRSAADGQKRKESHRLSRRSTSADSGTQIPLVDDKSLDSASEKNLDLARHKRRHMKPKKKDVETNTDQTFDFQQQQRRFFDEKELTPYKPLKPTKPISDNLHSTRRRAPNKELILTTPDTDTPIVRRTVKQTKDSNQDKDPVHVNVTVVVKKFASTAKDGTSHTTAEAFVEQKPQQYFEPVQHPPEILLPSSTTENKEKSEELIERPKSTEQQRIETSEQKILEHSDRHTQSDTEQIITDKQKERRRPKRISRTSQTYECVFRRMEREQHQDLRATSDTEKNMQTRKSQLRSGKNSSKKNFPVYLSTDSFRLEELLPKQYHQPRRNMSKSSSFARSLSPQGGKLLILRPTLPFHHTDAVNVHRVCLQYAIDLVPNENLSSSGTIPPHRNRLTVLKQPEQTNNLPMISTSSSSGVNVPTNKLNIKEKSASHKSEDYTHQRKNGGAV